MNPPQIPYLLTGYSLPHAMGYLPTKAGERAANPVTPLDLAMTAREMGLAGIEVPLSRVAPVFDGKTVEQTWSLEELRERLASYDMRVVADYGIVVDQSADHLCEYLRLAASMGAKVVRALLSNLLCGDRRTLECGWEARLEAVAGRLREALPVAEELGIALAMENHQDATTDDMFRLYEMSGRSPAFGVTLDTGNPLSVGEEPVEAARRLAPLIRHVHLKDYMIHFATAGYRLVRCPAGQGVIDFPAILAAARANGHDVVPGIEVAAQATRTIPMLEPGWWECHPNRDATSLIGALRVLWEKGRPVDEPYSSAWERGAGSKEVLDEEWRVLRESAEYFRGVA
jgi:sugar phosphate isomerase/epimerase